MKLMIEASFMATVMIMNREIRPLCFWKDAPEHKSFHALLFGKGMRCTDVPSFADIRSMLSIGLDTGPYWGPRMRTILDVTGFLPSLEKTHSGARCDL